MSTLISADIDTAVAVSAVKARSVIILS